MLILLMSANHMQAERGEYWGVEAHKTLNSTPFRITKIFQLHLRCWNIGELTYIQTLTENDGESLHCHSSPLHP